MIVGRAIHTRSISQLQPQVKSPIPRKKVKVLQAGGRVIGENPSALVRASASSLAKSCDKTKRLSIVVAKVIASRLNFFLMRHASGLRQEFRLLLKTSRWSPSSQFPHHDA